LRPVFGLVEDVEIMLIIPPAEFLFDQLLLIGVRQVS
jgi:hypothetical protein